MMSEALFYRCEKCGNLVMMVKAGGGTLTCCGQAMTPLAANSTDASQEKHVPAVTRDDGKISVTVGTVAHPMTAEHFIEWIAVVGGEKTELVKLRPGEEPKAVFTGFGGEPVTVYAYCNLHGLWKNEA